MEEDIAWIRMKLKWQEEGHKSQFFTDKCGRKYVKKKHPNQKPNQKKNKRKEKKRSMRSVSSLITQCSAQDLDCSAGKRINTKPHFQAKHDFFEELN